jgi:DNA-binding NtrC family response regulator
MSFPVETARAEDASPKKRRQRVARVLLADTALTSRLALKSILSTAGYAVSGAATAAEAVGKLNEGEYQLVLADLRAESEEAGPRLLAYARQKDFRPATALIASDISETSGLARQGWSQNSAVHISNENVYHLLDRVAELISQRADRRIKRAYLRAS